MTTDAETIKRLRDHLEFDAGQWREVAGELECDGETCCLHCRCIGLAETAERELDA